jgi:hypothetical protein
LVLSKEKPIIPYQPPLPPNEALSGVDAAAAGVTPVGLRPPFFTPAAAHSHPDRRGIPILIVALHDQALIANLDRRASKNTTGSSGLPIPLDLAHHSGMISPTVPG